ncbi:MAG: hypothetical protein JW954_07595 [Dehalococcoidaceae bacterium]|nr:hypothetical protein [Dehalococcoidaceae bacterium]
MAKSIPTAATIVIAAVIIGSGIYLFGSLKPNPIPAFKEAPEVMPLSRLVADYREDPDLAAGKHEGRTYLFPAVAVDDVASEYLTPQSVEKGFELYLLSQTVKFRPRYWQDLDSLGPGFIVDIVGEVSSYSRSNIHVINCTYAVLTGGNLPEPGGY